MCENDPGQGPDWVYWMWPVAGSMKWMQGDWLEEVARTEASEE